MPRRGRGEIGTSRDSGSPRRFASRWPAEVLLCSRPTSTHRSCSICRPWHHRTDASSSKPGIRELVVHFLCPLTKQVMLDPVVRIPTVSPQDQSLRDVDAIGRLDLREWGAIQCHGMTLSVQERRNIESYLRRSNISPVCMRTSSLRSSGTIFVDDGSQSMFIMQMYRFASNVIKLSCASSFQIQLCSQTMFSASRY